MRRLAALAAVVALGLGACSGGDENPTPAANVAGATSGPAAEPTASTAPGETTTTVAGSTPASSPKPDARLPDPGKRTAEAPKGGTGQQRAEPPRTTSTSTTPGYPFAVTLSRTCLSKGDKQLVTVKTRPHSAVAAAADFADHHHHGQYKVVDNMGPSDTWTWEFTIPPDAPEGQAELLLAVGDRSPESGEAGSATTGEGAKGRFPFTVKGSC
jgi:hypothetical protein